MTANSGFLVALVGADGAGKSTITALVAEELSKPSSPRPPLPAVRAYLGDDPPDEVPVLPSTRWLRRHWSQDDEPTAEGGGTPPTTPDPRSDSPAVAHPDRRTDAPDAPDAPYAPEATPWPVRTRRAVTRTAVGLNGMAEEWHQVRRALRRVRAGEVVLLDRHFFYDYYWHHVAVRAPTFIDRVHGRWVASVLPRPDLVICLDAPADLLYRRQPEGTYEQRVVRRDEYLRMADTVGLTILDAARPLPEVVDEVVRLVLEAAAARRP